ncbi:hypothetical protein HOLleu_04738 [Holothuria leucospilota]|uniref:B box-type domain-containing protein n=1 Tax=Holothuria leucospilota TaxID=206669 RepID=A0A9Q1HIK1_HOLLE|nr:hypothetical protein HOLleu_04738 [Holothuria leucospilota]
MRDAPRCHIHLEEIAKLYCETCGNLPICVACMHGEHKGHNLHEVKALANLKRKQLSQKLKTLEDINKGKNVIGPKQVKEELILNASVEKEKMIKMHHEKDKKIMTKIQDTEGRRQQVQQEKQNTEKKLFDSLQTKMEHEIQGVKKKYEDIFRVKKLELNDTFEARESSLEKELAKLREQREHFERDKKELLESIEKQQNENMKIIETMSQHFDNVKKRFETLNVMSSSILASDNDWSAVQCIPDMCTAAANLLEDLKRDFPEIATLTDVTVNYKQYSFGKPSVVNRIYGMTSSGDGNDVISGYSPDELKSFIIVIDTNGRILQEKKLATGKEWAWRYCEFLSQHKVATVSEPNEIGLYDVREGSYIMRDISDVISSWPKSRDVRCVTTDSVNNHILVGGYDSGDVYVFDDQLNFLHILTLPEMIRSPHDIAVSDGHLLVCDYDRDKCYVTTMDGMESKLVGEFMEPNVEGSIFVPISVCSDKNGFVYVLWKSYAQSPNHCYLVQYNQDGSQVLTTRKLDGGAEVVTVVETSKGEKILLAEHDAQTVYLYDLITED